MAPQEKQIAIEEIPGNNDPFGLCLCEAGILTDEELDNLCIFVQEEQEKRLNEGGDVSVKEVLETLSRLTDIVKKANKRDEVKKTALGALKTFSEKVKMKHYEKNGKVGEGIKTMSYQDKIAHEKGIKLKEYISHDKEDPVMISFREELDMLTELFDALFENSDRIVPFMQGVVQYNNEGIETVKYECLIRLLDKDLENPRYPGDFLNIAEKYGLQNGIAEINFEKALDIAKSNNVSISLNFGNSELKDPSFIQSFLEMVKEYKLSPTQITVEILEEVYTSSEEMKKVINLLREEGFILAVDDFGKDFSDMKQVETLDPSIVKLDKDTSELICSRLENGGKLTGELSVLFEYIKSNNKIMIAEGIEKQEQVDILASFADKEGVTMYFQGFYFHKPENPEMISFNLKGVGDTFGGYNNIHYSEQNTSHVA